MPLPTKKQIAFSIGYLAAKDGKTNIPVLSSDWCTLISDLMEHGASIPLSEAFASGHRAAMRSMKEIEDMRKVSKGLREAAALTREMIAKV